MEQADKLRAELLAHYRRRDLLAQSLEDMDRRILLLRATVEALEAVEIRGAQKREEPKGIACLRCSALFDRNGPNGQSAETTGFCVDCARRKDQADKRKHSPVMCQDCRRTFWNGGPDGASILETGRCGDCFMKLQTYKEAPQGDDASPAVGWSAELVAERAAKHTAEALRQVNKPRVDQG